MRGCSPRKSGLIGEAVTTGLMAVKAGATSRLTSRPCASLNGDSYSHRRPMFVVNDDVTRQSSVM